MIIEMMIFCFLIDFAFSRSQIWPPAPEICHFEIRRHLQRNTMLESHKSNSITNMIILMMMMMMILSCVTTDSSPPSLHWLQILILWTIFLCFCSDDDDGDDDDDDDDDGDDDDDDEKCSPKPLPWWTSELETPTPQTEPSGPWDYDGDHTDLNMLSFTAKCHQ